MQIIYVIGGVSPEYEGWLRISAFEPTLNVPKSDDNDKLRKLIKRHVDQYMLPSGQKYRIYLVESSNESVDSIYHDLEQYQIPRYSKSSWFNTDVWTIRKALNHKTVYNCRRLKPMDFARYLNRKYRLELHNLLKQPHNLKEQRFKRNFYSEWKLSALTPRAVQRVIEMFSAYLLLRNLISSVPKGCRKLFRKLIPLRIDDLNYDLKLLDYKFSLNKLTRFKQQINSLSGKPFGTAEFTNQYLIKHVPFLQIFNPRNLKSDFNL